MKEAPSVCGHETEGHRSLRRRLAGRCGLWLVAVLAPMGPLQADAVLTPWGNLSGIRVDGEWVGFEAGLRVVLPDWSGFSGAVKYLQKPTYTRDGNCRTVASKIGELAFTAALRDTSPGEAVLDLKLVAEANLETDGVYDETGPLRPTQRFWNLRQLGNTPEGARALPILCDSPTVTAAAFGDQPGGAVTVHLVNRGGRRRAVLSGLPESTRDFRIMVTDATRGMFDLPRVKPRRGRVELLLPAASYVTLVSGK